MRELLVEEMQEAGFLVQSAPGAKQGLLLAKENSFDLVVTDLRMPEVDGFDLIRDLNAIDNPPQIIMITAFGSIETAIRAVRLGAYDYITKPFEMEALVLAADKAMEARRLTQKVEWLQEEVEGRYQFGNIVAKSNEMREIMNLVTRIADSEVSVLITGESGTGKELIAKAVHYNSKRSKNRFVPVNLAAIPPTLIESELFGHKKGAFTGAQNNRKGLFEEADGGTIFLDEIGELALELQAKILRTLQEQEVRPVGSNENIKINVRTLAATNKDLEDMMAKGTFREDLYYRLNVLDLNLPPLRTRPDDILVIAEHFLKATAEKSSKSKTLSLSKEAQRTLLAYRWPGNVRELQNVIERGVALCQGDIIGPDDLPRQLQSKLSNEFISTAVARNLTAYELEKEYVLAVLKDENGNKTRCAQRLGFDRKTLYRKLEEYSKAEQST